MRILTGHKNHAAIFLHVLFVVTIVVSFVVSFGSFMKIIELARVGSLKAEIPESLLSINFTLLIIAGLLIFVKIFSLMRQSHASLRVYKFQLKIFVAVILVTVIPASIIYSVASFSLLNDTRADVSNKMLQNIKDSRSVANAYIEESKVVLKNNLRAMKNYVEKNTINILDNPSLFEKEFSGQAAFLSLTEAVLFINNREKNTNKIVSKTSFSFFPSVEEIDIQKDYKASKVGYHVIFNEDDNYIRVISEIDTLPNAYIMVGKLVNDVAVRKVLDLKRKDDEIKQLKLEQESFKKSLSFIFLIVVTLIVLTFILAAIYLVSFLLRPLSKLIYASEEVIAGNYYHYVGSDNRIAEMNLVISSFNHMLKKINKERESGDDLKVKSGNHDSMLKDLLGKLPSAVLLLNSKKQIKIHNKAAQSIFGSSNLANKDISEFISDIEPYLRAAKRQSDQISSFAFTTKIDGKNKRLLLYVLIDVEDDDVKSYILNFCDVTKKQ